LSPAKPVVEKSGNANNAAQINIRSICDLPARDGSEYPELRVVQSPQKGSTLKSKRDQRGWKEASIDLTTSKKMKPRYLVRSVVYFEPQQLREGRWDIRVHTPGGETLYITGFMSKKETEVWLESDQRLKWLEARGWGHWDIDPPKPGDFSE
jgi:hypothetical protein